MWSHGPKITGFIADLIKIVSCALFRSKSSAPVQYNPVSVHALGQSALWKSNNSKVAVWMHPTCQLVMKSFLSLTQASLLSSLAGVLPRPCYLLLPQTRNPEESGLNVWMFWGYTQHVGAKNDEDEDETQIKVSRAPKYLLFPVVRIRTPLRCGRRKKIKRSEKWLWWGELLWRWW